MEDIQIVQLSRNNMVVTFNKQALAGLKHGKAQAIRLKRTLGKDITWMFMRDTDFQRRQLEFFGPGGVKKKRWWQKLFSRKKHVTVRETNNRKYVDARK